MEGRDERKTVNVEGEMRRLEEGVKEGIRASR